MNKNKVIIGSSLGAIALAGLGAKTVTNHLDTISPKVLDTIVDISIKNKKVTENKAAEHTPQNKYLYSGFAFDVVTTTDYANGRNLAYFANKRGVSTTYLRDLNSVSNGNRITDQYGSVYPGTLLFYKAPSDYTAHYKKSQASAKSITTSNWKSKESIYLSKPEVIKQQTAEYMLFSLNESDISINATRLRLKGWAAQTNYTHTTGSNNKSAIAVTNTKNKNTLGGLYQAKNTNINPSSQFIYNANNPSNQSLRCPNTDVYLDRPHSFDYFGGWSSKNLQGCWHEYKQSGFEADVQFQDLFGSNKHNEIYNLWMVQSTGSENNRLFHKKLVARMDTTNTKKIGTDYSGTVHFKGGKSDVVNGKTTVKILPTEDNTLLMRKSLNSSTDLNYGPNGTHNFKAGTYKVVNDGINTSSRTQYFQLEGFGPTAGYNGWTSTVFLDDESSQAQLSFTGWSKAKLNFVESSTGNKIQPTEEHTLQSNGSKWSIKKEDYAVLREKGSKMSWKMDNSTSNRDFTKEFQYNTVPTQETYRYTRNYDVTVNYINANTGKVIHSKTESIPYNSSKTFSYNELGATSGDFVTYSGDKKQYKFASTLSNYSSEFSKVGLPSNVNNQRTQTRTYNSSNLASGVQEVNFYYYEPQEYTVNHVRLDSNEKMVLANGTPTTDLAKATVTKENSGVKYYTGDNLNIKAYGKPNKAINTTLFGDYKFSGKGSYYTSSKIYNAKANPSSADYDILATGDSNVNFTLEKLEDKTTSKGLKYGTYSNLYYRKAIKDPSGHCDITLEKCDDDENPNTPNPITPKPDANDYKPAISGQYNWYLTKDQANANANWKQSQLATSNTGAVGNKNVLAVIGFENSIDLTYDTKVNNSTVKKTDNISKTKTTVTNDKTIYYNTDLITKREVQKTLGEGLSTAKTPMSTSLKSDKLNETFVPKTNATVTNSRKYDVLEERVVLNSKLYDGALKDTAGKNGNVEYGTKYNYTNVLNDKYVSTESYEGATFVWEYDYSNPVFGTTTTAKDVFDYKNTTKVDHKLNEDDTTALKAQNNKATSKIGILRNFNNLKPTTFSQTFTKDTTGATELNESITKQITQNDTLTAQSKVLAKETILYSNDLGKDNNGLSTKVATREGDVALNLSSTPNFVKYHNKFTKNQNGYNKYLVPDVDYNFRNVSGTTTNPEMGTKNSVTTTELNKDAKFKYQIGVTTTNQVVSTDKESHKVELDLTPQYSVFSDSGFLYQDTKANFNETNGKAKYKTTTGYDISDSDKLITQDNTYYFIPTDGESPLQTDTVYTNRTVLSNVGLSDRNIALDNTFKFDNFLVGSTQDKTKVTSTKGTLSSAGSYSTNAQSTIITSTEKEKLKNVISDDSQTLRTLNIKDIIKKVTPFVK